MSKARERSGLVWRSLGEGWRPFSIIPRKGSEDLATSSAPAVDPSNLGQAPKGHDDKDLTRSTHVSIRPNTAIRHTILGTAPPYHIPRHEL